MNTKTKKAGMFPTEANRAIMNDQTMERGEVLPIGQICHVTTAQFAYRGRLVAASKTHYYLEDAVYVMDTGRVAEYTSKANQPGSSEAEMAHVVMAERGATTAIWLLEQDE